MSSTPLTYTYLLTAEADASPGPSASSVKPQPCHGRPPPFNPRYSVTTTLGNAEEEEQASADRLVVIDVAAPQPRTVPPRPPPPPPPRAIVEEFALPFRVHDRLVHIRSLPHCLRAEALLQPEEKRLAFMRGEVVSGDGQWTLVSLDAVASERQRALWTGWMRHCDQCVATGWRVAPAELHYFVLDGVTGLCFRTPASYGKRALLALCSW